MAALSATCFLVTGADLGADLAVVLAAETRSGAFLLATLRAPALTVFDADAFVEEPFIALTPLVAATPLALEALATTFLAAGLLVAAGFAAFLATELLGLAFLEAAFSPTATAPVDLDATVFFTMDLFEADLPAARPFRVPADFLEALAADVLVAAFLEDFFLGLNAYVQSCCGRMVRNGRQIKKLCQTGFSTTL